MTAVSVAGVLAFQMVVAAQGATPPPPDVATAVYLTDYPDAKCLDGSPGYYYLRRAATGSVNSTKWVIHMEGGGWCHDPATCVSRAHQRLGSSNSSVTGFADVAEFSSVGCTNKGCGALMLNDPVVNELSYDWNAVFMRYCDGMSFAGNASAPFVDPATGETIYFRGIEILHATYASLVANEHLGDATIALIGGSSAGGLATYFHADVATDLVHAANAAAQKAPATVISKPDSGFWPSDINERFYYLFTGWFALQGNVTDGLAKHCKWRATNVTRCLFPEYFADEITTPLWPLQSLYDPLQAPMSKIDPNLHGEWLLDNINRTVWQNAAGLQRAKEGGIRNGGFVYSCSRHCGGELLTVQGHTAVLAMEQLLTSSGRCGGVDCVYVDVKPYPCTACCNDPKYPPTSIEL